MQFVKTIEPPHNFLNPSNWANDLNLMPKPAGI